MFPDLLADINHCHERNTLCSELLGQFLSVSVFHIGQTAMKRQSLNKRTERNLTILQEEMRGKAQVPQSSLIR